MKPSIALNTHRAEIRHIVEANRAVNARVFGSVLYGEDTEESDLDILVDPKPEMTLLNPTSTCATARRARRCSDAECTPRKIPCGCSCRGCAGMSRDRQRRNP